MGLDDFQDGTYTGGSGKGTGGSRGGRGQRTTKIDFSQPYIQVVKTADGAIESDQGPCRVLTPEDQVDQDYVVLFEIQDRQVWRRFVKQAEDELGIDLREVKEKNPDKLKEVVTRLANPEKPSPRRTCQVCGDRMSPDTDNFYEIDLHETRMVPVHSSHTVDELAEEGLLE